MRLKAAGNFSFKQIFFYLMLLSLIGMALPLGMTEKYDHLLSGWLAPLMRPSRQAGLQISRQFSPDGNDAADISPADIQRLRQELELSQIQNANLRQELCNQKDLAERMAGLRQLFRMERVNFIAASVVGMTADSVTRVCWLDQGSDQQVQPGQFVLGAGNWQLEAMTQAADPNAALGQVAVGRILSVGRQTSKLQLLSDPAFRVPVTILPRSNRQETWQAEGMLVGQGRQAIRVTMVSANYPILDGDPVYVRRAHDALPVDMIAGTVENCRRDEKNPVMYTMTLKPAIDLNRFSEVVIVAAAREPQAP